MHWALRRRIYKCKEPLFRGFPHWPSDFDIDFAGFVGGEHHFHGLPLAVGGPNRLITINWLRLSSRTMGRGNTGIAFDFG